MCNGGIIPYVRVIVRDLLGGIVKMTYGSKRKNMICLMTALIVVLTTFAVPAGVYGAEQSSPVVQKPIFTVKFDANGGAVSIKSKQVQQANIYGSLPEPTRSKYIFRGWYTAATGGSQIEQFSSVNISGNQTLYARWQKVLSYDKEVLKFVNIERGKQKLVKLKWDKKIYKGTAVRAGEITKKFSHVRPNGGSGARFLLKYVKKGRSSGECLGMGFNDPQKLVTAFMGSPTHKRIIMMKKARTCAISSKIYDGTTYWCLGTSALYR